MNYNSVISCRAAMECLFRFGDVWKPEQAELSDEHFEMLVFLKYLLKKFLKNEHFKMFIAELRFLRNFEKLLKNLRTKFFEFRVSIRLCFLWYLCHIATTFVGVICWFASIFSDGLKKLLFLLYLATF